MKLTGEFFSLQLYWFPRAVVIEQHKLCGLKQENFNVSKFWSLEVNTVSSFWRLWGKIYPMPPFLASGDSQQSFLQMHHYNICLPHMTFQNSLLPDAKSWLIGKDPDIGNDLKQEKGKIEDKMVGWHHWLSGHKSEQIPGDSEGQGSLAWSS